LSYAPLAGNNAGDGPFTIWVKYDNSDNWVPVMDPAILPLGNTSAEYMVIDKDGRREHVGPTMFVVLPPCSVGEYKASDGCQSMPFLLLLGFRLAVTS
jgi:hypothetical protein